MNPVAVVGLVLTVLGVAGYAMGVGTAYTGRAFSITLVMAGVTLIAIRQAVEGDGLEP